MKLRFWEKTEEVEPHEPAICKKCSVLFEPSAERIDYYSMFSSAFYAGTCEGGGDQRYIIATDTTGACLCSRCRKDVLAQRDIVMWAYGHQDAVTKVRAEEDARLEAERKAREAADKEDE